MIEHEVRNLKHYADALAERRKVKELIVIHVSCDSTDNKVQAEAFRLYLFIHSLGDQGNRYTISKVVCSTNCRQGPGSKTNGKQIVFIKKKERGQFLPLLR